MHKPFHRSLIIFVSLFLTAISALASEEKLERKTDVVVVVVLDGTRRANAYGQKGLPSKPFLKKLMHEGAAFQGQAVFPTNTLTNFMSISTGSYPDHHGVANGNSYYDDKFQEVTFTPAHVAAASVFEVLEQHGMRGAFLSAKGYDAFGIRNAKNVVLVKGKELSAGTAEKNKYKPTLEDKEFSDGLWYGWERDDQVAKDPAEKAYANKIHMAQVTVRKGLETLKQEVKKAPVDFIIANFHSADLAGHTWGAKHPNYDRAVTEMSKGLEYFVHELQKIFAGKRLTLIVTADHGFPNSPLKISYLNFVGNDKPRPFDTLFAGIEYGVGDCGSSCASFFIKDSSQYREAFDRLLKLKSQKDGWIEKIYTYLDYKETDGKLQDMRSFFPGRTAQFFVDIRKEWSLSNVFGHGTNGEFDLNIPMIFWGAGIQKTGLNREKVSNVDIAPTALSLLGISAPAEWDGKIVTSALIK